MRTHCRLYIAFGLIVSLAFELVGMSGSTPEMEESEPTQSLEYSTATETVATVIGSNISANWSAPDGHAASDYLCVAKVHYTGNTCDSTYQIGVATSGTTSVSLPNAVSRYEIRLFRGTDNVRMATSSTLVANAPDYSFASFASTVAAGGQIFVTWTAPQNRPPTDRIALVNTSSGAELSQQYDNGVSPKILPFDSPTQAGQYEFRYHESGSSLPSAISHVVTVVASAGSIAGRVRDSSNGSFVQGALVEAMQSGVTISSSLTNSSGSYVISVSSVGTFDIRVSKSGFATINRNGIVVASGSSQTEDFTITDRGAVSGVIKQENTNIPIAGAQLRLIQSSLTVATKVSDFSGNYTFLNVASGTYSVEVSAPGFQTQTQSNVVIAAGTAHLADFQLVPAQGGSGNLLEFLYDDAGRLVATKEQGILTRLYTYDPTGNLLSIKPPPATAPAIISFSPGSGPVGTQVVIRGLNFAAAAGQNSVSFNGTAAIISSFSTTELIVTVPSAATSGPISVASPGGSVESNSPFHVGTAADGQAPTITNFSPSIGHPGDPVTISGANFESEASDNDVRFGSTGSPVTSASATSLIVPASTSSGKISVASPYGTGYSQSDFLSVPNSFDLSKTQFAGKTWFGHSHLITLSASDRIGLVTFDAVAGKRFSLQLTYLSRDVRIDVLRPDGKVLTSGTFGANGSTSSWFIDTQPIQLSGTHTVIITPTGTSTAAASLRMIVHDVPPDVSAETIAGSYKTLFFGVPGQNGNLKFSAEAGQRIIVEVKDNTLSGTLKIRPILTGGIGLVNADGSPMVGSSILLGRVGSGQQTTSVQLVPLFRAYTPDGTLIPATGSYDIALDPSGPNTGTMTVSIFVVPPDPTYSIDIGSSRSVTTSAKGQNAWLEFDGTAGQRISIQAHDVTFPNGFSISLNKPDGTFFVVPQHANNGTFIDTLVLPVTGRYKILVDPPGFDMGSATIDLFDVPPDIVGSTSINGTPVNVSSTVPGHNPTLTFTATQGQQARIDVSSSTYVAGTMLRLLRPDGNLIGSVSITSSSAIIDSVTLPTAGTYKVVVDPPGANVGSATISVGGDVLGTITVGGASSTATINNQGQNAWLTFSGTAGQRISLKLSNVSISSGSVSIRKADGSYIGSFLIIGTNFNFIDTLVIPSTGQYSVLIDPSGTSTGSATVNLYSVPADAAGSITVGSNQTKTTTIPGQNLSLSFTGTLNQEVSVELVGVSITSGTLRILKPDGSNLASTGFTTSGAIISEAVIPSAGTYQIYIDPNYDYVGSLTIQLFGTGTGVAYPNVQLSQAVSVQKGYTSTTKETPFSSVSVQKGFGNSPTISSLISNSVSVTKGPHLTSLSPQSHTKNSSLVLTIIGHNLNTANAIYIFKSDRSLDTTFTVSNINVNSDGTVLTATIQSNSSTVLGERIVVVSTTGSGLTRAANATVNILTVVQ